MELFLKNIGKIGEASVEIEGITAIAGENNTGKSTVSRALFAMFNSFCGREGQIAEERVKGIANFINRMALPRISSYSFPGSQIARKLVSNIEKYKNNNQEIEKEIVAIFPKDETTGKVAKTAFFPDPLTMNTLVSGILERFDIPDAKIFDAVLEGRLQAEFDGQINNIFSPEDGKITLREKGRWLSAKILDNTVTASSSPDDILFCHEAVYLDDPLVLDENLYIQKQKLTNHRYSLLRKLVGWDEEDIDATDRIIINEKINDIYNKISSVCDGAVIPGQSFGYRRAGSDKVLSTKNLSMGLKTFAILKKLLENGSLRENGLVILDEPEIHLHPEWQLLFAEVVVLLQKEFGMKILLNTHSPYFLNALEVYAARHEIADKCKYYQSFMEEKMARIEDVTGNLDQIYAKLARPLQKLENLRYQDDET